jgi:hypothetical protein
MKIKLLSIVLLLTMQTAFSQNINSEMVEFQLLKQPKILIDENSRKLKVVVTSPYNVKVEDIIKKSKEDFQTDLKNYSTVVLNSEKEYQLKLKDHDAEVKKAKEQFELENAEFKKYSLLERLAMTDQKKNPVLVIPSKPVYYKPAPPVYAEPNLNDFIIVDNNVLSSKINITGFAKEGSNVEVLLDLQQVNFQDNAGQTFANQPTKLIVKVNGVEKTNTSFFNEFKFVSSAPTNNINKPLEEKNHLNSVITFLNQYLNDNYGFQSVTKSIRISNVKNKGKYDDLERANLYVTTNLKKLQPELSDINDIAYANMKKGTDIWQQTLEKIDYKDSKADFNSKIAKFIYFNFMRLNVALDNKKEAEKYLNQMQENLIYMDLSYDEKSELQKLEKEIYKSKK